MLISPGCCSGGESAARHEAALRDWGGGQAAGQRQTDAGVPEECWDQGLDVDWRQTGDSYMYRQVQQTCLQNPGYSCLQVCY